MHLSLMRSWAEECKLRIFDNVVIVIVLALNQRVQGSSPCAPTKEIN
jgi:hypothetical protein